MQKAKISGHWISEDSILTFVENTISNSSKVQTAKFLGSDGLFCFISICQFSSFKNPFAMITSLSKLSLRSRRFILLVQMKKVFSINYGSSTSSLKPWRWCDFTYLWWHTYIHEFHPETILKFTNSSRSTKFKDIKHWNISQIITMTISISPRRIISYAMKWGILFWVWWKVNENCRQCIRTKKVVNRGKRSKTLNGSKHK